MEIPVDTGFAFVIEKACQDFEILLRFVRQEIVISRTLPDVGFSSRMNDFKIQSATLRDQSAIMMAPAKSFLFYIVRARRICEHGSQSLDIDRLERRRFLKSTECVVSVRDVNEHGFDASPGTRGKKSKPAMHPQTGGASLGDETSLAIHGEQQIWMGPINLCDLYPPIDRIRKLAGFESYMSKLQSARLAKPAN